LEQALRRVHRSQSLGTGSEEEEETEFSDVIGFVRTDADRKVPPKLIVYDIDKPKQGWWTIDLASASAVRSFVCFPALLC
jgi:hypothetical protein